MNFRTERLTLRPWALDDGELLAELFADEGFRNFSLFEPMDAGAAQEFLRVRLERCRDGFGLWAVFEDGRIVGNFQLFPQTLDDRPGVWPEIGYRLRPPGPEGRDALRLHRPGQPPLPKRRPQTRFCARGAGPVQRL